MSFTEQHRYRVEQLAQFGSTPEDIAAQLQIPLTRLQKRFHRELARGRATGKHIVLEKLFENASSGNNMSATSLWVKSQCGWRDTGASPQSPTVVHSILKVIEAGNKPVQTEPLGKNDVRD
ncbi:MAG: hypothetical protein JO270_22845 [Acidobacteriaceae bacterium]|nr:hypothetical protein [Acidobacteriaceae bacterium]